MDALTPLTRFARRYLFADAAPLSPAERRRSTAAALLGVLIFEGVLFVLPVSAEGKRLLAPLGATSVILFALPHSPLAQPWSVAGGLFLPALIGYACGAWIPWTPLALAAAVGISVFCQGWLRCIHPPGGAMALVMAFAAVQGLGPGPSLAAAAWNVAAMLIAAMAVNNMVPGRRYPLCAPAPAPARPRRSAAGIQHPDLEAALREVDAYLDVSEEDLLQVFHGAARHAFHRHILLTCAEVMRPAPLSLEFATDLNEAWRLMHRHGQTALPVVDRAGRVIGLLSLENFLGHVEPDQGQRIGDNVRRLLRPTPATHSDKPEVVGQIMQEPRDGLLVAHAAEPFATLADALGRSAQPVVPVVDEARRLIGLITPADIAAVLLHHQALDWATADSQ